MKSPVVCVYGLIEETYIVDGERRLSYGIAAYANSDTDGTTSVVASVRDITSDRERLACVVDECNRAGLSLAHLCDVIEDHFFLA